MTMVAERPETRNGITGRCPRCGGSLYLAEEVTDAGERLTALQCRNCGREWPPEALSAPAVAADTTVAAEDTPAAPVSAAQEPPAADTRREFRKVRLNATSGTMIWEPAASEFVQALAAANPDLTRNGVAAMAAELSNLSRDWATKALRAADGLPESAKGKPGRPSVAQPAPPPSAGMETAAMPDGIPDWLMAMVSAAGSVRVSAAVGDWQVTVERQG